MDQELLESVISGADALCEYCGREGSEECDNCIVLSLRDDAQEEYDSAEEEDDEDHYVRSSTCRDYGPSNPWDAPGMSVKDFI